jgi:hypothetical protein
LPSGIGITQQTLVLNAPSAIAAVLEHLATLVQAHSISDLDEYENFLTRRLLLSISDNT